MTVFIQEDGATFSISSQAGELKRMRFKTITNIFSFLLQNNPNLPGNSI